MQVKKALLSVTDKTGLIGFAGQLHDLGIKLISTGGTATEIAGAGIPVTQVEEVTGVPEMMDGRVKTMHPKIMGGILARRDVEGHMKAAVDYKIGLIDLVCVNLYQFEKKVAKPNVTVDEAVESIDIGGPSMIRAAAKNWRHVAIVVDPSWYNDIFIELAENNCELSKNTLYKLMRTAFHRTFRYDHAISQWLDSQPLPDSA